MTHSSSTTGCRPVDYMNTVDTQLLNKFGQQVTVIEDGLSCLVTVTIDVIINSPIDRHVYYDNLDSECRDWKKLAGGA